MGNSCRAPKLPVGRSVNSASGNKPAITENPLNNLTSKRKSKTETSGSTFDPNLDFANNGRDFGLTDNVDDSDEDKVVLDSQGNEIKDLADNFYKSDAKLKAVDFSDKQLPEQFEYYSHMHL